jgi:hypothetical protein
MKALGQILVKQKLVLASLFKRPAAPLQEVDLQLLISNTMVRISEIVL